MSHATDSHRRQRSNECALFAACSAYGVDYTETSDAYARHYGCAWADDSAGNHRQFIRKVFGLRVLLALDTSAALVQCLWGCERFIFSAFDGSTHVAHCTADNIVNDGIFPQPLPYAQYVRLLGNRGGRILGEHLWKSCSQSQR